MEKQYIIFSIKYSPGLAKELLVFYEQLKEQEGNTKMILSRYYLDYFGENDSIKYLSNGQRFSGILIDLFWNSILILSEINKNLKSKNELIFYNPHPINLLIQLFFRSRSKISVIIHEPPKSKTELKEHKLTLQWYIKIVTIFQFLSMTFADRLFLVSPSSFNKFKWKEKFQKKDIIQTHLLHKERTLISKERFYFSFIGHIFKGKGFEDFINLINYCLENQFTHISFCVITSSPINTFTKRLYPGHESILKIINKSSITDFEIDEVISKSIAILLLHKVASQSGILPLAFMLKTPVICRNLNAFNQYVINENTGLLIDENFSTEELYNACLKLENKEFNNYVSNNAYLSFQSTFSDKNFMKFYEKLIKF